MKLLWSCADGELIETNVCLSTELITSKGKLVTVKGFEY